MDDIRLSASRPIDTHSSKPQSAAPKNLVWRYAALAAVLGGGLYVPAALYLTGGHLPATMVAGAAYTLLSAFVALQLRRRYPHQRLGLCNIITQLRAALVAALAAALFTAGDGFGWGVLIVAVIALSLDGIDGWAARRSGLLSRFGARFDVEVDSILALILALLAFASGKAGAWVLLLGSMRYIFMAATLAWPWLAADMPERFSRKLICVIQIGVLIALVSPIVEPPLSFVLAATGTGLLLYSFGRDVVWLAGRR